MDVTPVHEYGRIAVGVRELRARLADIVARVESGETVIVKRGGHPVARLCPVNDDRATPRDLDDLALLGLIERPWTDPVADSGSPAADSGALPLPVDVRVDAVIRQIRG